MKQSDWNGYRIPLIAHAFSLEHGMSVDVRLRAGTYDEAVTKLERKLQCRQDFLDATKGKYQVQFSRVLSL